MAKTKRYILKITGWLFLFLFLLVLGAGIVVYFKAENYINKNLSGIVDKQSNGLYQLDFDKIELQLKPLSITISAISLTNDEKLANEILKKQPDKTFYSFRSPKLKLTNIKFIELIRNHHFNCKNLTIVQPEFSLSGKGILKKNSAKNLDKMFFEFRPLFKKWVKRVTIKEIDFVDANYKLYHSITDSKQFSNARKISIGIKNFTTDSAMIFTDSHFFDSDDIVVKMNGFQNNLSDSLHVLTIDTLEYSLKTTDILARGFHLFHKKKNSDKNLYNVVVPQLHINSKNLADFSIKDTLKVQFVEFVNPQIEFFQKENRKKIQLADIDEFNLYSLVENQFSEIKIDSFILTNANLKIFQQPDTVNFQQHFRSVTVAMKGFELNENSAQNKNKLFHSDDLEMFVNGYKLRLTDNQHEFSADSMFVSTTTNLLGLKNIRISPAEKQTKKRRTGVNVSCEALEIDNVNLKTLFHTRTIPTRNISITNPIVQIEYHTEIKRAKKKKETGLLFAMVTAYLKGVYSEVVNIKNGSLKIQTFSNNTLESYFETGFNFNLTGFSLDSASMEQTDKFFYANHFDIHFSDYQMKLADNLHKINVDRISIQSFDRKLEIENLHLKPVVNNANKSTMQRFNRSGLFDINVPKITLWGVNLRDAFFHNKLIMDKFQVASPKIYFENFGTLRQTKEKKEISEVYRLIFKYIYDFDIKEISIPDGNFTWINHTKKGKTTSFDNEFSASLFNFKLNENELNKKRLLFSDNFDISVKNQLFLLSDSVHILRAGEINFSSKAAGIKIKNALLYPDTNTKKSRNLPTTFRVYIPELNVTDFDYIKAYYSRQLQLNRLEINSPKFEIYNRAGTTKSLNLSKFKFPLPAFIKSLQLNELKINNGKVENFEVNGTQRQSNSSFGINLSMPNVSVKNNSQNQIHISTGNLIANISDFNTSLGDHHKLHIANLDFNREEKTVAVSQLNINAFTQKSSDNRFTVSAPKILFSGFDVNNAIENNYFKFDEIKLIHPAISIEVNDSIKGDKLEFAKNLDLYPFVESYVDRIKINDLLLQNIDLKFNWLEKKQIDKQFNLRFNQINIGKDLKPENVLNSKEFELSTTNLKTKSENGFYEFSADSLIYNSAKHNTLLKNIKITPLYSPNEFHRKIRYQTDYVTGKIESIELQNVDENRWLQQKTIHAGALVIGKTKIDILRNKRLPFNTKQRPPWPQDLLLQTKQKFVFDSVLLLPSTLRYSELTNVSDKPGFIEFEKLTLKTGRLSNINEVILQNPNLQVDASTMLYNKGLLAVGFNFDLNRNSYNHRVTGSLSPMPLKTFNKMLENSAPVSIESGQLNRFDFDIYFTETVANGKLFLGYDNFKISVLNSTENGTKKSKLASFWANKMVLNSKNPKGNTFLPTTISYEKDIQRSIINYWWKALFTGAKETIGIKPAKKK